MLYRIYDISRLKSINFDHDAILLAIVQCVSYIYLHNVLHTSMSNVVFL
jgi:hypothetical protein